MRFKDHPFKNSLLCAYVACIIYSGFAYPLSYGRGFWPWNRGWFMFSSDNGYDYQLTPVGEMHDGTRAELGVTELFRFAVGDGNRFQETPRYSERMLEMAKYLCTRYPVRAVSLIDHAWRRSPGRRIPLEEVPEKNVTKTVWVDSHRCGS